MKKSPKIIHNNCVSSWLAHTFETEIVTMPFYSRQGHHSALMQIMSASNKKSDEILRFLDSAPNFAYNTLYRCENCLLLGVSYYYTLTGKGLCFCDYMFDEKLKGKITCVRPFIFMEDGSEICTFVLNEEDSKFIDLIQDIEDRATVEIMHKSYLRRRPLGSFGSLFQTLFDQTLTTTNANLNLSELEFNRIRKALVRGYYDIPSQVTLNVLSLEEGVSKSALSESLRKAQHKILSSVIGRLEKRKDKAPKGEKDKPSILVKLRIQRE